MSANLYLLSGEAFLADEALARIRREAKTDPLAEASFGPADAPTQIRGALETPSLLGGRRLVIVRDVQTLKKDHLAVIEAYLRAPSADAVLVLIAQGRTKLQAAVKAADGEVIALEPPQGRQLVAWIRTRARSAGLELDDRGAWAIIDAVGSELRDIGMALEQLSTGLGPGARVGAAQVRAAFPRLADERIYAFTDAVGERKLGPAMTTLRRLLQQGDEPLMLFGALTAHVRRMLVGRDAAEGGPAAMAEALSMPEWRAKKLYAQVRAYKEQELIAAMALLARTDVEMKGGDLSPELALERAVIQIVTGTAQLVLV